MKQYESFLYKTFLLQELNPSDIKKRLKAGELTIKSYKENTVIHFEGEPCTKLEIILAGEVVVERLDEAGGLLTIAKFTANDILGGNLLFSKTPSFPMTVTTSTACLVVEIGKEVLFDLFVQNPSFLRKYLEYVSDHTSILGYKLKHYINKTIRESLMSFLEHESKKQNSKKILLNMTKKTLSEKLGVQRTSLSRELSKMVKDGLIEFDKDSITLL